MTKPSPLGLAGGTGARGLAISPRAAASDCVHRWRYEEPNGTWARGECKHCGAETWGLNGDPGDYDVMDAPQGYGMAQHRPRGASSQRKHDWNMNRFVADCPHCAQRCDLRGLERHIQQRHPEVA